MTFNAVFEQSPLILMEGAIIERLKREYGLVLDVDLDLAGCIYHDQTVEAMTALFNEYILIAKKYNLPFIMTTPTRRANKERINRSPYDDGIIRDNVKFLKNIQNGQEIKTFVGGLMGCKGDAYLATDVLSVEEAMIFHAWQANILCESGVDFLFAGIMPALSEAIGMAKAMEMTKLPYIISFMIKEDGRLIDGTTIHDAIVAIDQQTLVKPLCYMTNCVHPNILKKALSHSFNKTQTVLERFKGIQANASSLSPDVLDGSHSLKSSSPESLAHEMISLCEEQKLKIFGGCCGTTNYHIDEIAKVLTGCSESQT
jgi:S-methylmethionine-dependent homocysteine/selenocysteine methylase